MLIYLYDGSFEGLLTCVYEGYYSKLPKKIIDNNIYIRELFDETESIISDNVKADKVARAIVEKLSEDFFHKIVACFFSEDYNLGTYIFEILRYGFKEGSEVIKNIADKRVKKFLELSTAVLRENHLLVGLVRFSKLKGDIYYCQFSPTYNQIPLLLEHFVARMHNNIFVIHDIKRNIAVFYNKETYHISEFFGNEKFVISEDEIYYRELWREFHKKVAIKERLNPKLQRSFMPKKYHHYLTEMNAE